MFKNCRYETSNKFTRFTEEQLMEIRKIVLSKVICTNGDDIGHIQKYALDMPDPFLYVLCRIIGSFMANHFDYH